MPSIKEELSAAMLDTINQRIESAQAAIDSAIESRNTATKSTAGDKHETGRALMQTEIDNQKKQLGNSILLKSTLSQIPNGKTEKVDFGSLLNTNHGRFYISVSLGKVEFSESDYFAISPAAPLAQSFMGAVVGDIVSFQGRSYEILSVE